MSHPAYLLRLTYALQTREHPAVSVIGVCDFVCVTALAVSVRLEWACMQLPVLGGALHHPYWIGMQRGGGRLEAAAFDFLA